MLGQGGAIGQASVGVPAAPSAVLYSFEDSYSAPSNTAVDFMFGSSGIIITQTLVATATTTSVLLKNAAIRIVSSAVGNIGSLSKSYGKILTYDSPSASLVSTGFIYSVILTATSATTSLLSKAIAYTVPGVSASVSVVNKNVHPILVAFMPFAVTTLRKAISLTAMAASSTSTSTLTYGFNYTQLLVATSTVTGALRRGFHFTLSQATVAATGFLNTVKRGFRRRQQPVLD